MRIVIVGGPHTGKTTLANKMGAETGVRVLHSDSVMGLGWSEASAKVAEWFDFTGPWLVEGAACARALRKWMASHPGKPCDRVLWLTVTHTDVSPGQAAMAKGVETVLREITPELKKRGVEVRSLRPKKENA